MAAENSKVSDELSQLKTILNEATHSPNPLVQQALQEERNRRKRKAEELTALLNAQQTLVQDKKGDLELEKIKAKVADKLKVDAELIAKLNQTAGTNKQAGYTLKNNKMKITIEGAEKLLPQFESVFNGNNLAGLSFDYQQAAITILGDNGTHFGTGKGIYHETLALTTHLACLGKTNLTDINLLPGENGAWHQRSALVYDATIPSDIDLLKLDPRFAEFTYAYPNGRFGYVHGDYAFGGGRDGNTTNPWVPQDCSSWIAKLTGSSVIYATADQLCYARAYQFCSTFINQETTPLSAIFNFPITLSKQTSLVPAAWATGPEWKVMKDLYEPATVLDKDYKPLPFKDPQREIQAGQIYFHRNFDDNNPNAKLLGTGGHTGLVLGFLSRGAESGIAVLSYNRNLEGPKNVVGFGVEVFPYQPKAENNIRREVYFTNMAKKVASATTPALSAASAVSAAAPATASVTATTTVNPNPNSSSVSFSKK